jgi:exopolyphosphatase/guanosine-5'-triphosphate,3'-diphosphate pyrophosphatase
VVGLDEVDIKHSEQVFNLAMLLFKQLRVLHKLPRIYVKVLRIASVLHDSGKKINSADHAKYSYYSILGADVFGAGHKEIVMAAFVASLHAGADLNLAEWIKYKDLLTEEDLDAVKKLGVMLSLAEKLDRLKNSVIVDVNCDILGDSVIMKTVSTGDADYQICKALECCKDFEKYFNKKLEIL